jgi:shikimate kinase
LHEPELSLSLSAGDRSALQRPIALIGMPGAGKSSAGRQMAARLRRAFIDSDAAIEQRLGGRIRDFFEREGEAAFRDVEQQVLAELLAAPGAAVIATGGGAVLRPANRAALQAGAVVVYLRSSPEALFRRLRNDTQRPLLQVADPRARLHALYAERDPLYLATAHHVIETARQPMSTLVSMVLMQLEMAGAIDIDAASSPVDPPPPPDA